MVPEALPGALLAAASLLMPLAREACAIRRLSPTVAISAAAATAAHICKKVGVLLWCVLPVFTPRLLLKISREKNPGSS
jgi:hypothetical protein